MSKEKLSKLEEVKTVVKNIAEFVDAIAFAAVAISAVVTGLQHRTESVWYWALLAAGALVSVQAFGLLVKHFSKKA